MISKNSVRKNARLIRASAPAEDLIIYSEKISKKLCSLIKEKGFSSIHIYITNAMAREPDTLPIIKYCLESSIKVYVPFVEDNVMKTSRLRKLDLKNGEYGLLIPAKIEEIPDDHKYELIVVPTLAFDKNGNRLGSGKGMYDRFLHNQKSSIKIGLCYEINRIEELASEKHDVKPDMIITDI